MSDEAARAPIEFVLAPRQASETRKERTLRLLADAETIETVYGHICNGGSLIDLCETWDVRYVDIMRWIDADASRQGKFRDAIKARDAWTDEMILAEIRHIARFDFRKLYNEQGTLRKISELDPITARAVQSVDVEELFEGVGAERAQVGNTVKVKLWDKLKAAEMVMKNRGLIIDRHAVAQASSLEDLISGSWNAPLPAAKAAPAPIETTASPAGAAAVPTNLILPAEAQGQAGVKGATP